MDNFPSIAGRIYKYWGWLPGICMGGTAGKAQYGTRRFQYKLPKSISAIYWLPTRRSDTPWMWTACLHHHLHGGAFSLQIVESVSGSKRDQKRLDADCFGFKHICPLDNNHNTCMLCFHWELWPMSDNFYAVWLEYLYYWFKINSQ